MKSMKWMGVSLILVMSMASVASIRAVTPSDAQQPPPKVATPVKIDLTLTRLQGEKKLSSMPYSIMVMADDSFTDGRGSLRIGFDVPTGSQTSTTSQQGVTTSRADYRNIGIQADVRVQKFDETRYRVQVNLTDSGVYSADADARTLPRTVDPVAFRSFSSQGVVLLRDNQASQVIVATDKITGETLRADVTLSILK